MQPIREWHDVDAQKFRDEILTQYQPAILRGVVKDWPVVRLALSAPESAVAYLRKLDCGNTVDALRTPPHANGRIFYNDDMSGFNYVRSKTAIASVIDQLVKYSKLQNPPALAVQSALIAECLPGFLKDNPLQLLDESIQPRIWIGNGVVTPAHFDESNNIACVAIGRRRFTLFPPEQIANLYIGPLGHAPTGTPISLVSFREPDFARFPRFKDALAAAQVAELGPGDAIYIPTLWWHHVESLEKFNALVNYWWKGHGGKPVAAKESAGEGENADAGKPVAGDAKIPSALDCLLHCLVNFNHLAPEHKVAWQAIFEHYVFNPEGNAGAHIPENRRGVLGEISPELAQQVRAFLVTQLQKR